MGRWLSRPEESQYLNLGGIQAITLDVGGTLIEPWPSVGHVYAQVAARHGCQVAPERLNAQFAAAWRSKSNFRHTRTNWRALVDQTFAGLIRSSSSRELFDEIYCEFGKPEAWRIFDDVPPALEQWHGRIKLAVVSNWDERLRPLLDRLRLSPFFQTSMISAEVGYTKPEPGIFLRAVAALGVAPSTVLHIGDSLEEDYQGARSCGLRALLLDRRGRRRDPWVIRSLTGLG